MRIRIRWGGIRVLLIFILATLMFAACNDSSDDKAGGNSTTSETFKISVTTPILGSLTRELVQETAEVTVIMPNGTDPHSFSASAKQVAQMTEANLLIINGRNLEEGLAGAIKQAERAGVPVFTATDHAPIRQNTDTSNNSAQDPHNSAQDPHNSAQDPHNSAQDPHIWLDPIAMKSVISALAEELSALGFHLSNRTDSLLSALDKIDAEIRNLFANIPPKNHVIVTDHSSFGYFADRYGFTISGVLVDSLSSQAETSAAHLAELIETIEEFSVPAIFIGETTSPALAKQVEKETGVHVVSIPVTALPEDRSYFSYIREIALRFSENLSA